MRCRWYCTADGPNTNLDCLHCGTRYCGACLHGEAGKMSSLIKCASCGKKPRTKSINALTKAQPDVRRTAMDKQRLMEVFQERTQRPSTTSGTRDRSGSMKQKNTIYDRLCDTSAYTGTHKHRFDKDGHGRGLMGRDSIAKGGQFGGPNALDIYNKAKYFPSA